jgi:hypothetical protein
MESFWGSLTSEMNHHQRYATGANAESAIKEYIEIFYNRQREAGAAGLGREVGVCLGCKQKSRYPRRTSADLLMLKPVRV